MTDTKKGVFATFEGIDCSGKTSAIFAAHKLFDFEYTREPGGTEIGEELRRLILTYGASITNRTEALLFYTNRVEHCANRISPVIDSGRHMVCDRYYDSSLAYQGANGNEFTQKLHNFLLNDGALLRPDKTILFDISIETYLQRKRSRGVVAGEEINAIEDRDVLIYEKTLAIFRDLARDEPNRFIIVDASVDIEVVQQNVFEILDNLGIPRR